MSEMPSSRTRCGTNRDMRSEDTMAAGHRKSTRRDVLVPSEWTAFYEATHIPAAVRVGETLHLTGHTGETPDGVFSDDAEAQIRQTFQNIALTLAEAGATWSDVVELTSYHVGLRDQSDVILEVAAAFLDDPYPAWSAVGVTELFDPGAIIEISCTAIVATVTPSANLRPASRRNRSCARGPWTHGRYTTTSSMGESGNMA